ncbi:nitric oxide synthase-like protein isoform X2 [Ischnura elegans]|uniref:nitric oxide synthase-like protein isoform X2 n=1 Tax=Ischnura elegans TaxID=197161 RepID=UPI001ED88787|nr:nitric oxide synthase-like protein isoform X2 [Ischnura elegans]
MRDKEPASSAGMSVQGGPCVNGDGLEQQQQPQQQLQHNLKAQQQQCTSSLGVGSPYAMRRSSASTQPVIRLRNHCTKGEVFDSLHQVATEPTPCSTQACLGSIVGGSQPVRPACTPRSKEELLRLAKDFYDQYFASNRRLNSPSHLARWDQVQKEILSGGGEGWGTYKLTETELVFGAKLAWRNSVRCIGRIQWSKLQVFDCRYVTTTSGMFEALCNHIKYSTNKGNIRSAITVFPQRTDGRHDFRVWNPQLISYAGYKHPDGSGRIIGDPLNVEFTEVCMKLGWRGKGGRFDILPLVLSANGHDPDYFDLPPDIVMEVPLTHPTFEWFEDLQLRWYALPAVSGMLFDVGGLEFPACPFNGWYMSTEIGCRDLCDVNRYNLIETVAQHMGLDTRTPVTLWKDKAMVEVNVAVLHSFQSRNVTIVDHHTASESFMKHIENEGRLRKGCPADWVWIVPPLSSSATPVFHQEMALYFLKPSYEYQEPAWKTHIWKKGRELGKSGKKPRRKFHFKQIARAVKFTSKLFGRALSRRIKATVLYATETGKSEMYAKKLAEIFGHAFNSQVHCMDEYDMTSMEHEALLLVVASTFGNGDPPENGETFAQNLYAMKMSESSPGGTDDKFSLAASKSFIKMNSQTEQMSASGAASGGGSSGGGDKKTLDRLDSLRGSVSDIMSEDNFGPLSNVRFAVFALGSSAYPNFCAFGKYVDNLLGELGGERLFRLSHGDEMCGQEQAFRTWASNVFTLACEAFCLDDDEDKFLEATLALKSETLSASSVRLLETRSEMGEEEGLLTRLSKCHNKKVLAYTMERKTNLHNNDSSRATYLFELSINSNEDGINGDSPNEIYQPGDHVGVFPCNRTEYVDSLLKILQDAPNPDTPVELQVQKEKHTPNGITRSWEPHDRLPVASLRTLFTRFLDITSPPSPFLLQHFASIATDPIDREKLDELVKDSGAYEDWRHWNTPHLAEALEQFPSVRPDAALLTATLPQLQPRFYSISSSPALYPHALHLTVAVVTFQSQGGEGPVHYGVCSNYLKDTEIGDTVYTFIRSAPNFRMPADQSRPIIMVGPGTGIAPFRGFWQHRMSIVRSAPTGPELGKTWLFFGCRQREMDLYREEKAEMLKEGILSRVFLALSREPTIPKTYVQEMIHRESSAVYRQLVDEGGHFYVCGDCTMAEHVYQTLKQIIQEKGGMSDADVESYMLTLRDENRYHEDIFGITLRTAEVHHRSRESARIRMASQP